MLNTWKLGRDEKFVSVNSQSQLLAEVEIYKMIDRANARMPSAKIPYPNISFGKIKALGMAHSRHGIMLSGFHLEHYGIGYLMETGAHEVAHWIVFHMYPLASAHGPEFRMVAKFLGCSTKATRSDADGSFRKMAANHGVEVEAVAKIEKPEGRQKNKQHQFEYSCSCRTHLITTRTHNLLTAHPTCRKCGVCKGRLTFVKQKN